VPRQTFFNLPREKRQRIAELAVDEFARQSYAKFSISRFVAGAGIAKGSFYQYFEDKLDLYRWILFDHVAAQKLAFLRAHPPPEGADFFDQLEHIFLFAIKFGLAHPHLSRVAAAVWHSDPADEKMAALTSEFDQMRRTSMRAVLQQGIDGGRVRSDIDIDLGAELVAAAAGPGLDMALRRKLGVDLIEFCARPELADRFPEAEQRKLISGLLSVLRRGMQETGTPPSEGAAIDLDAVPFPRGSPATEGDLR
jgi:TetR/AcrR family transcriptional regulator